MGQKKGKASKKKPPTSIPITAVLLDKFQENVPRGEARTLLKQNGYFKRLYAHKDQDHRAVDSTIRTAFNVDSYLFLECIRGGNKLIRSSNQRMNGTDVIVRRGCLYLCKVHADQ